MIQINLSWLFELVVFFRKLVMLNVAYKGYLIHIDRNYEYEKSKGNQKTKAVPKSKSEFMKFDFGLIKMCYNIK